ncbi:MAG TPA: hypothetical protein VF228_14835 [Iamia sp.]
MQIHAWLEERDIRGLRRSFRARVIGPALGQSEGVGSVAELHHTLDRVLGSAGLLDDEVED